MQYIRIVYDSEQLESIHYNRSTFELRTTRWVSLRVKLKDLFESIFYRQDQTAYARQKIECREGDQQSSFLLCGQRQERKGGEG